MSRVDADSLRRLIEAWNAENREAYMEVVRETAHPEIEWHPAMTQLAEDGPGIYKGYDGVERFWSDSRNAFELKFSDVEIRELDDAFVVLGQATFRGRNGEGEFDSALALVMTVKDGLVIRNEQFLSHDEALAAAGAA